MAIKKYELECSKEFTEYKSINYIDGKPVRNCKLCDKIQSYSSLKTYSEAEKLDAVCVNCYKKVEKRKYIIPDNLCRLCPICNNEIQYKTKTSWKQAERKKTACRNCADEKVRQTTRSLGWINTRSNVTKRIWTEEDSIFKSEIFRNNLSQAQINRTDDRIPGAQKAWNSRTEESRQAFVLGAKTESANNKRSATHIRLREEHPEYWQTDKVKAGWIISGEKGKTYIDKAIQASQSGNNRSIFERSYEELLGKLGFIPTQKVGGKWVDYANHETKMIVECYGDWYHCHPKLDKIINEKYDGIHPENGFKPSVKREKDIKRLETIEELSGYRTIVIWQNDTKRWISWIKSSLEAADKVQ